MNRRAMLAVAALAGGVWGGLAAAAEARPDEASLAEAAERLRRAMIAPDASVLDTLFSDKLTYGHSDGRVQTKDEIVAGLVEKRSVFHTIEIGRQTILLSGDVGVVRHRFVADAVSNGKPSKPDIAVLQVWQWLDGRWRLLVRQAHI